MGLFGRKPTVEVPEIPKQKRVSEDCVIEIKNTPQGRKIKFKGNCKKEQIEAFAKDNNFSSEEG